MDKQAEICETYQLKWSSYNTYIHSCIATSLHNPSFADVALVTADGHQIMAHRFVLSYSSQYLNQILKFQPKVTTALPLMIVMPPEIDYKSLKVLVRYMYSGEAKVSKEILKTVLKGGDILQIKGLYREKEELNKNTRSKVPDHLQKDASNDSTASTTSTVPTTITSPLVQALEANQHPIQKKDVSPVTVKSEGSPSKENIQYQLMIKEEPIEWSEADMELIDSKEVFEEMTVKSENTEHGSESTEQEEETMFSPLTCRTVYGNLYDSC
ncbi:hypothetical protein NQ317_008191 [Molorchus minor]|uniref:BTB domain-containing protein n=1 Tax=Molorchus minor TaxID=1323400 RepID=A0ABQ9J4Q9_9CUCU|nr:hypothetical protein NQ317_008191 [Molorchus minor]